MWKKNNRGAFAFFKAPGLTEEIATHAADIESASAEKATATELRETTRSDFVATLKEIGGWDVSPWGWLVGESGPLGMMNWMNWFGQLEEIKDGKKKQWNLWKTSWIRQLNHGEDYTESIDAVGRALKVLKEEKPLGWCGEVFQWYSVFHDQPWFIIDPDQIPELPNLRMLRQCFFYCCLLILHDTTVSWYHSIRISLLCISMACLTVNTCSTSQLLFNVSRHFQINQDTNT